MAKGFKTGGRQKGTPNKATAEVKQSLLDAFEKLGGVDGLVRWGIDNPTEFYKLWVKVMPVQQTEQVTDDMPIQRIELVTVNANTANSGD